MAAVILESKGNSLPQRTGVDPRVVRTRAALRDALAAEIVTTGDLAQVTVTGVTGRAGLTRRTFYSHYRDIADLVNCVEAETLAEMRRYVAAIAAVHLDELETALRNCDACPGAEELLSYLAERGDYLAPLLGDAGDPAFAEKIKAMVRDEVRDRALSGFDMGVLSNVFDYYLIFAISAEVGVLVRWLTTGMRESVGLMARVMTGLMFVRPGDLYAHPITFDLTTFGMTLAQLRSLDAA